MKPEGFVSTFRSGIKILQKLCASSKDSFRIEKRISYLFLKRKRSVYNMFEFQVLAFN